jgi:hypothetical protein
MILSGGTMAMPLTEAELFARCTPNLTPRVLPTVSARVYCPETTEIRRIHIAMDPVTGRPAVVSCSAGDLTCEQVCLVPADGAEPR